MSSSLLTTRSSTIHKIEYLEREKSLDIEFRSGNVYRYYKIPHRLWKVFKIHIECGGSAGSFFNDFIKKRFNWERVREASS